MGIGRHGSCHRQGECVLDQCERASTANSAVEEHLWRQVPGDEQRHDSCESAEWRLAAGYGELHDEACRGADRFHGDKFGILSVRGEVEEASDCLSDGYLGADRGMVTRRVTDLFFEIGHGQYVCNQPDILGWNGGEEISDRQRNDDWEIDYGAICHDLVRPFELRSSPR